MVRAISAWSSLAAARQVAHIDARAGHAITQRSCGAHSGGMPSHRCGASTPPAPSRPASPGHLATPAGLGPGGRGRQSMDATTARRLWAVGEPVHALTLLRPRVPGGVGGGRAAGFWRGYFATHRSGRSAPRSSPPPSQLRPGPRGRAVPEVWSLASPADVWAARPRAWTPPCGLPPRRPVGARRARGARRRRSSPAGRPRPAPPRAALLRRPPRPRLARRAAPGAYSGRHSPCCEYRGTATRRPASPPTSTAASAT